MNTDYFSDTAFGTTDKEKTQNILKELAEWTNSSVIEIRR